MTDFFLQILLFFYNTIGLQNLGITIVEIAVLSRLLFYPLLKQQLRYSQKMREIQPLINALKAKHKDDQQALGQAQMELFKTHGINPAGGCLPAVVQIVVLIGLLGALNKILAMDINTSFLIWNMAKPDVIQIPGIPFPLPGILVILASATQYIQTKMMMPPPPAIRKEDKPKEKEEKADFMSSFAEAQSSMMWMFPVMFLLLGLQWPSGLALYWTIGSVLMIAQQLQMNKIRHDTHIFTKSPHKLPSAKQRK